MSESHNTKDGASAATHSAKSDTDMEALSFKALVVIYMPALVLGLGAGIALPAVPSLAKSFDVSFGVASWVVTAHLLGNLAGTLPTGWLIDRFGRRLVMIGGPIVTALAAFAVFYAGSFAELLVWRFVGGWASQMWLMGRLSAISQGASPNQRGRQVSWMFGMDNTGMLAGPLAGGAIASQWGEAAPFLVYGAVSLLALVPTFLFPDRAPGAWGPVKGAGADRKNAQPQPQSQSQGQAGAGAFDIIRSRLAYFAIALFAGLTRGPLSAGLLHLYAAFAYDLGAAEIGLLATAAAFISWPIGFLAGWMMDRFGRKRTMTPGFGGVGLAMGLLAVSAFIKLPFEIYVPLFFLAVALQALTGGSVQTIGADVAPAQARGRFLGIWRFTGQGGAALSPMIFAFIADHVNYGSAFLFTAAASLTVAFLVIFRVPETRKT
jgi:MFS family permease